MSLDLWTCPPPPPPPADGGRALPPSPGPAPCTLDPAKWRGQPHGAWSSFAWPKPVAAGGGPGVGAGAGTLHGLPLPGRPGPGTAPHLQRTSGLFPWDLAPLICSVGAHQWPEPPWEGRVWSQAAVAKGISAPNFPPNSRDPPTPTPTTLQPGRRILEQHRPGPGPYHEPEG